MNTRLLTICLVGALILVGCGKGPRESPKEEAERQARAKAAADEMLASDQAKFREIAQGRNIEQVPPKEAPPAVSGAPQITQPPAPSATPVTLPESTSLAAKPTTAQTFGFDDSPDGMAAKRLLSVYVERLKDPESAKFRNLKGGSFRLGDGSRAFGVCGEVNARNSFGGYTGFEGFVVWAAGDRQDHIGKQSTDDLQNMVWLAYSKSVGCLSK